MDSSTSRPSRKPSFSSRPRSTSDTGSGSGRRFGDRSGARQSAPASASRGPRRAFSTTDTGSRSSSRPSSFGGGRSFGGGSRGGSRGGNGGGRGGRKMQTFDVSRYINLNPVDTTPEEVYEAKHTFKDFGLEQPLVTTITNMGLTIPSPIQDQIIPHILDGRDVVGLAQTGTGKTAAFLVPTINKTLKQYSRQTLILAPTRELAIQVEQELKRLTEKMKIFSTVCVGGMNIRPQIQGLRRQNHFIIGTPGRVQDLIDRGHIKPAGFSTIILDEADRMLDMGFIHDMRKILKDVPDPHETLFFSATMSDSVKGLIHEFMNDPVMVSVRKKDITGSITQDVVYYEPHTKFNTLVDLLKKPDFTRVIIFGAMKHSVEKLSQELMRSGIKADAIHGNKSHPQRQRALQNFKSGRVQVLVATDVAARGIHVDDVSHVINYDLPNAYEDYVHRIGRTGRADKRGQALTFVTK